LALFPWNADLFFLIIMIINCTAIELECTVLDVEQVTIQCTTKMVY
jgi:hypothetical protein